ncbi:unnamed protein product, partial [Meganyctiphanes norvegica]
MKNVESNAVLCFPLCSQISESHHIVDAITSPIADVLNSAVFHLIPANPSGTQDVQFTGALIPSAAEYLEVPDIASFKEEDQGGSLITVQDLPDYRYTTISTTTSAIAAAIRPQIHTTSGEALFQCPEQGCDYTSKRRDKLKNHMLN